MNVARERLIRRWKHKLAENIAESERQAQFAGERFGVLERLRELQRQRRQIALKLMEYDAENKNAYYIHMI